MAVRSRTVGARSLGVCWGTMVARVALCEWLGEYVEYVEYVEQKVSEVELVFF